MVFREITRNEQLLDNIFPKHIIQILKSQKRQAEDVGRQSNRKDEESGSIMSPENIQECGTSLRHQGKIKARDSWVPTQTLVASFYDNVSIFFADVVSFTNMSSRTTPVGLVQLLNHMFEVYDQLATLNGVEKIKTIGDCYMAATGLPEENPHHAQALCRFGL